MKLTQGIVVAIISAGIYLLPIAGKAQVITAGPDSVAVQTTTLPDTLTLATKVPVADTAGGFFLSTWDRPAKAALYSALLPGAGQVYNKAIWKVPIIYAAGGVLGYFLIDNNNKYQDFRKALLIRNDGDPNTVDKYATSPVYYSETFPRGKENLRSSRDFYRRNRDLTVLLSILAYGLNIAEAYVHAHLKTFDVSDDLGFNVQPTLVPVYASPAYKTGLVPGITLTLYTTK